MNDEMWNEFDDVTAEMINSENSSGRRIVEFDEVLYNCIAETARTELRNTLEKLVEGTTRGKILVVGGHGTGKSMLHQLADLVEDKGEFYLGRIMDNAIIDDCTAYPTKEKGAQWKREQAGRGKRFR